MSDVNPDPGRPATGADPAHPDVAPAPRPQPDPDPVEDKPKRKRRTTKRT